MKLITKFESQLNPIAAMISADDVFYCQFQGVYTACKIKSLDLCFTVNNCADGSGYSDYLGYLDMTIETAFDHKPHNIKTNSCSLSFNHKNVDELPIDIYADKKSLKYSRRKYLPLYGLISDLYKLMYDNGFGVRGNYYYWDGATIQGSDSTINHYLNDIYGGTCIMRYDILNNLLYGLDTPYVIVDGIKYYHTMIECENDNEMEVYEF